MLVGAAACLLLVACDGNDVSSGPERGATRPATTSPPGALTREARAAEPRRQLVQLASGRGEGRAAVWRSCPTTRCRRPEYSVTTTADGFLTSHSVALPGRRILDLTPAGDAGFVVRRSYRPAWLLSFDGTVHTITTHRPAVPAEPGDVVVPGARGGLFAVDTDTAVAHRVPTPAYFHDLTQVDGRLRGITYPPDGRSAFAVSVDGGATWGSGSLPVRHALWMPVTGGRVPAFIQGADGATLFPFVAAWRFRSGTFQRSPAPAGPTAYVSCAHRLRDGRLMVCVDAWSDQRRTRVPTPPGFWVSTDSTWSDFEPVEPGPPFDDDRVFQPVVVGERSTAHGLLLVVTDPRTGRAWATRDLGHTFTRTRVR